MHVEDQRSGTDMGHSLLCSEDIEEFPTDWQLELSCLPLVITGYIQVIAIAIIYDSDPTAGETIDVYFTLF